jgi:sugar/nucleoside kinase (ribokinase family)
MKSTKLQIRDIEESYISKSKLLHTTLIHPKLSEHIINLANQYNVKVSIDLESQIAQQGWNRLKKNVINGRCRNT